MALLSSIISYWKLDESSGNAVDSHSSNDLTNNNTTAFVAAKINNGADFETSSSNSFSISDANQTGLEPTSDFSVSMWVKPESLPALNVLAQKQSLDGLGGWAIYITSGGDILFQVGNGVSQDSKTFETNMTTATWYHIVCTWKASTSKLNVYKDGTAIGEQTGALTSMSTTTTNFTLGANQVPDGAFFDGILDEVGFWKKQLSSAEVTSLYNGGSGLAYPFGEPVIAADATSTGSNTGTSVTVSHTCTGSNRALVVCVRDPDTDDNVSGVTYNGVALTKVQSFKHSVANGVTTATSQWLSVWCLINPASGTNNVVVSMTDTINTVTVTCASYTGVNQSQSTFGAATLGERASGERTISVTTANENSWLIVTQHNRDFDPSAAVSGTLRAGTFAAVPLVDSDGPKTAAGAYTIGFNYGGLDNHIMIGMYLEPAVTLDLSININDSITVTENVSMNIISFINVNDSISVAENVNNDFVYSINIFDSISLTENLNIQSLNNVNVNDSISVTESVTVLIPFLVPSVNDTITITENLGIDMVSFINVSDSITVTESTTILLPFLAINVNDSISITEYVALLTQVLWAKRTAISTTFSNRTAVSTTFTNRDSVTTGWNNRQEQPGGGDP